MIRTALRVARRAPEVARTLVADPAEGWGMLQEKVARYLELRRPRCPYEVDPDWERQLHEALGAEWPCGATAEFWASWPEALQPFRERGIHIGRGTFGGWWGDGDPAMVRALWCLVRHRRPVNVVETGVARGFTSRFVLDALERNGSGHLWSIDLPMRRRDVQGQVGSAIPDRLRHRWSLLEGSSRKHLPRLLSELGQIDLFVHDSSHTGHTVRFELDRAWAALRPGGAVVVDDVDDNWGFHTFTQTHTGHRALVCYSEPLEPDPPRFDGRGLFGIICKDAETAPLRRS